MAKGQDEEREKERAHLGFNGRGESERSENQERMLFHSCPNVSFALVVVFQAAWRGDSPGSGLREGLPRSQTQRELPASCTNREIRHTPKLLRSRPYKPPRGVPFHHAHANVKTEGCGRLCRGEKP